MMDCAVDFDVEPISIIVCKRKTNKMVWTIPQQFAMLPRYFQKHICICFGFFITMPRDWPKKLAPICHPIRSKCKSNRDALALVFPRFAQLHDLLWVLIGSLYCLCKFVTGESEYFGFGCKTLYWKRLEQHWVVSFLSYAHAVSYSHNNRYPGCQRFSGVSHVYKTDLSLLLVSKCQWSP